MKTKKKVKQNYWKHLGLLGIVVSAFLIIGFSYLNQVENRHYSTQAQTNTRNCKAVALNQSCTALNLVEDSTLNSRILGFRLCCQTGSLVAVATPKPTSIFSQNKTYVTSPPVYSTYSSGNNISPGIKTITLNCYIQKYFENKDLCNRFKDKVTSERLTQIAVYVDSKGTSYVLPIGTEVKGYNGVVIELKIDAIQFYNENKGLFERLSECKRLPRGTAIVGGATILVGGVAALVTGGLSLPVTAILSAGVGSELMAAIINSGCK